MADPINPAVESTANDIPAAANLTIQDLSTAMQIIQVVGARGAIKAEEMATVGALYTKLKTFLDAAAEAGAVVQAQADADAGEGEKGEGTSPEPEPAPVNPVGAKKPIKKSAADEIIGGKK